MFNVALPSQDKKSEFYKQKPLSSRTNILDEFLRVAKTQDNRQNNFVSQYRNDEIY
ncbi:APG_G0052940.mRNA.1.CDS.1 [Saccharomyces cerevisiae]|nr:APG_G0052940.mRNA.1.CDS.1 [Saccharomyces cerevisiae]CAI7363664.1 APG_G0052940.mRNA.1.CDS.1 [Saccharomyces cerevisiae]